MMATKNKDTDKTKAKTGNTDSSASKNIEGATQENPNVHPYIIGAPDVVAELWGGSTKAHTDDPLLGCLEIISSMFNSGMSTEAFKVGLPLVNGRLTPDLFVRAAARANLSSKIVKKNLTKISKLTLPCVLLLEGNKACLLASIDDDTAEVIFPEMGKGSQKISIDELSKIYSGFAIFARPQYKYDSRSSDLKIKNPASWFWGTLASYSNIYGQVAIAAILVNIFAIASPIFTLQVYDRVVPNNAVETMWFLAIGIGIIFIFDFFLKTLRAYFVDEAGKNVDVILSSRIFEHVMGMKMSARPESAGSFASELREFEALREFFSSITVVSVIDVPFIFLFILVIWLIGGPIALVPIVIVPIVCLVSYIIQLPLKAHINRMFREASQKHALLVEAISGHETIKSLGVEGKIQRRWENFVNQAAGSSNKARFISGIASNFSAFMQQLSTVIVIIVGVYLIQEKELTMGGLIACSILTGRTLAPLGQIVALLTRLNHSMSALKALDRIIKLPVDRPENSAFLHRPAFHGGLEFQNVIFKYPRQKLNALDDISFKVTPGEKIGIVGKIGSGKTTIEKLILGLYDPDEGAVLIDGTDIRQLDPAELRASIGYVPQDVFLFYGSVKDNIAMGDSDTDDAAIVRAAHIAGVDDFVKRHPMGFDMPVGEGGTGLSGGQKQSIALARALVRDPAIILFDEPTAMMDTGSEAAFVSKVTGSLAHKTLILVTHKLSLLSLVDRVIVTDNGKIVVDGPREAVLKALTGSQINSTG